MGNLIKKFSLTKSGLNKISSGNHELKSTDVEEGLRSCAPGEWCLFLGLPPRQWIGYVNQTVEDKYPAIHIVHELTEGSVESFSPKEFIENQITKAFHYRLGFKGYEKGSRLFYGDCDGLPGLIIDGFVNGSVIQINTAGIDKFREQIKSIVESQTAKKAYFLDNQKYREKENLPRFDNESLANILVFENECNYEIRAEVVQKIGFYYDHRENRKRMVSLLKDIKKDFNAGLDLFCYVGAWGHCALKAGVKNVDFVDQGDFDWEINRSLELNNFQSKGQYFRQDVFKFLDQQASLNHKYDVVMCDPPAFAKSPMQKNQALDGYTKLHRKVLKCLNPGGIVSFSSCTHYVTHDEFQKNIADAARKEGKTLNLLYSGIQGWDHPISQQSDRSNYIKCYIYIMR